MAENPENPLLDRLALEERFGGYQPPSAPSLPNVPFSSVPSPSLGLSGGSDKQPVSALKALDAAVSAKRDTSGGQLRGGSIPRSMGELTNPRYNVFVPGDYNNEDAYAQGQSWTEKMVNGVGKGLALTGTTFLQGTVGFANGIVNWIGDGKFSSFYDNDLNRKLDDITVELDRNLLPNYETDVEKNARWYSRDNLFTANFLWNGIVKNLGFAAGAALSGGVYAAGIRALSSLPLISRLISVGKQAEVLAATEASFLTANKAADTYGKIKSLSDRFLSSYNVLNPGGRFVVSGLATTGEAGFEAFQTLNEKRNQLIEEHLEKHDGVMPTGEDLAEINRKAERVGNAAFLSNVALLTATNYIQFPKILGSSYTSEKGMMNSLVREIGNVVEEGGKYVEKPFVKNRFLATLNKIRPYTFSVSEGFEEGAQFAIGKGVNDYYNKKENNEPTSFLSSIYEGFAETFGTDEGIENILIGGLSGAIMQAKGRYSEQKEKTKNTAAAIQDFQKFKLSDFTKDTIDSVNRGTVIQQEREEFLKKGDVLNSKDKEADYVINYLSPRIKYGRYDLVRADLDDYAKLASTDEGFAQLQSEGKALETDTREAFLNRIQLLRQTAENVKSLYQSLNLRYGGVIDKNGKPVYTSEVMDKMVYAASKVADYDNRIPSLSSKLLAIGVDVDTVVKDTVNGKVDTFNESADKIKNLGNLNEDEKMSLGEALEDVAEMSIRRDAFLKEYDKIKNSPKEYQEVAPIQQTPEDEKKEGIKKVVISTAKGDKEFEIGKEYFMGRRVEESEEGFPIFKFPKFTILGELPDGKIRVRGEDGKIHDITKNAFKKYKFATVESTLANRKAKFFLESAGKQFAFKRKSPNKPDIGWLEWSDDEGKLLFVFNNARGERVERVVEGRHFVAQQGFKEGLITRVGEMTPREQQAFDELTSSTEGDMTVSEKRSVVSQVLASFYESSKKNLDEINKKLEQKKQKISDIQKELQDLTVTKKGQPRKKITKTARKAINELYDLKEAIDDEVLHLEEEKDYAERNVDYLQAFITDMENAPLDEQAFMEELKEDIKSLEEIGKNSADAISFGGSLLASVNSALQTAFKMLDEFAKKLREQNPTVPASLEALRDKIEKFYGEEGIKTFEEQRLGFVKDIVDIEDQIEEYKEELNIPDMTKRSEDLLKNMEEIQDGLEGLGRDLYVKKRLLEKIEDAVKRVAEEKAQQEAMLNNETLANELLKTSDPGLQTRTYDSTYEPVPKKSDIAVVLSTKVPSNSEQPHVKRANLFGVKHPNLKNKDKIKGIVISQKNEEAFGMKGLMQHLKDVSDVEEQDREKIKPEKTVALLMVVETKSGSFVPVDVNGQPIDEPNFENAIYQAFPDPSLEWSKEYGGGSMFRKETPQDRVDYYKKQYAEWHSEMLENPTNLPHSIEASFGIPQIPTRLDDGGKPIKAYDTRTAVTDAGLINEKDLLQKGPFVYVSTKSDVISRGSTFFESSLGRPFLALPNAYAKLMNRKLTNNEVSTIYEAIYHLSQDIFKNGNAKSEKSKRLINWLRSIIYWGTPKNASGRNSIFFEKTDQGFKIFFSNKGKNFLFTPQSILDNKNEIISELENMYNNINSGLTDKQDVWNQPYEEIVGFDENGEPIAREVNGNPYWPNYQTYLLSGKNRKPEEIPLSTQMRPLIDENDVNRDGIYFTLTDTADSQRYNNPPKPAAVVTPIAPKGAAAPAATQETQLPEEIEFDGVKENTVTLANYGVATFKLNIKKYVETDRREGFTPAFDDAMVQKVMSDKKKTEDEARIIIAKSILAKIGDKIENYKKSKQEGEKKAETPAPTPTAAPTYDLTGQKENVLKIKLDENNVITVMFKLNGKEFVETDRKKGLTPIFDNAVIGILIDYFKTVRNKDIDEARAQTIIAETIIRNMQPYLEQFKEAPPTPAVSDIEARKADIRRRRKEELDKVSKSSKISVVDEIKQEIGSLKGEQRNVLTENTRKIVNAYRKIFGYPPFTGDINDYLKALREAEPYYANDIRLNSLDLSAKFVIELAEKVRGNEKNESAKIIEEINARYDAELAALGKGDTDTKADREKEIKEFIRNVKYADGKKPYDDPNVQDTLEISESSRNVANALSKNQPLTFEFLKNNIGALFTTNSNNVIKVSENKFTNTIELIEEGTVRRITIDKNDNVSYDFEDKGKQIVLQKARPISFAEAKFQSKVKEINAKYDALEQKPAETPTPTEAPAAPTAAVSDLEKRKQASIDSIEEKLWKNTDLSIATATITDAEGNTKTISDTVDVVSGKDPYARLKQKIEEEYRKQEEAKPAEAPAAPAESPRETSPSEEQMRLIREQMRNMSSDAPMRRKLEEEIKKFKPENWSQVEKWLKANFPNVPVYRVKNIIQATNGAQAWGMFKDGAIYINENAEVGTAYHEVFHAVWRMFSDPVEQASVLQEMRNRQGTFFDRTTFTNVSYFEATDDQLEDKLAEEFRDYVQFKKIPPKPKDGRPFVVKLFSELSTFIKEFFTGRKAKSNTEKLFKRIGSGYYARYSPYHASLAFAKKGIIDIEEAYASSDSAFRIKDIPADKVHEIMQQMTYTTLVDLVRDNKSLFSVPKLVSEPFYKKKLYERLLDDVQKVALKEAKAAEALVEKQILTQAQAQGNIDRSFALWKKITDNWEDLKKKHEEYLKTYNIEFDENDGLQLNSDERAKESGWQDATKIDVFRKANAAVKLLISTIPIVNDKNEFAFSSIGGVRLLPTSQVFMSLMNNLHTSRTPDEMMERLRGMAENDPNYRTLYERLTNSKYTSSTLDLSEISDVHDAQMISAFWRTFKKQNPDVKNVYIFENGDVEVGDSNFSTAARQVAMDYVESFKNVLNSSNPYFEYSKERKAYIGKPDGIKDVKEGFKKADNNIQLIERMVAFLNTIGIEFKKEEILKLKGDKQQTFKDSVEGIILSIEKAKSVATISGKVLAFQGRFMGLSTIRAMIDNPEFDSTFFNVKGERVQSFIGTNAMSDFYDVLSQVQNKNELAGTPYAHLLTDEFSQYSLILDKVFDRETGEKLGRVEDIMKPGYVDGTVDEAKGKKKESSKLTYKQRLIQEINMNLKGFYYNLVPGDASIEWMVYMGNHISADNLLSGLARVNEIFKGYFMSELALSRSNRPIVPLKDRKKTDLRFLKPILDSYEEGLHDKIVKDTRSPEEVYNEYKTKINKALESFINKDVETFKGVLQEYEIIKPTEKGTFSVENIAFKEVEEMSEATLNRQLTALSVNFMINNIELHKLIYSDPYQYKDELKRIKSFNSPRQAIINGSKKMNQAFENIYNRGRKTNDVGRTDFIRDFFRTATIEDVLSTNDLEGYGIFEETDGGGVINLKAYRNFRIRAGEWNENEERQFNYDIAYEKVVKGEGLTDEQKEERGLVLTPEEAKVYNEGNPKVKSTYTPLKPIVSGNKGNNRPYNDVVLDKFALYPLSFRVAHELNANSNAVKQYDKMMRDDIDYVVFGTGRKVGAEKLNPIYNEKDGSFNNDEYEDIINIPFGIISIQSEVPSKDTPLVTRGSQVTKLVTLDYMESGVPIDFDRGANFKKRFDAWNKLSEDKKEEASPIYKEMKNNQTLLIEIMKEGYQQLLKEMGIEETVLPSGKKSFQITNFEKAATTLRDEILKRDVNDNINDALTGFLNGEAVLEATPAYQQVRNILYSIADKRVISPKISGGQKVQIPSTFFEENRLKAEGKEGKVFSSEILDFYKDEDGKRVCEIMVGRWFNTKMSDEELLNYLNNTEEGQKILKGVAFRIPTQKQNSIDVFKIKKFIPKEFGDSVVIPSALVKKVGSDFDIDKLSIYFKNIYKDISGKIKMVELKGSKEDTKNYYGKIFDEKLEDKKIKKDDLLELLQIRKYELEDTNNLEKRIGDLLDTILENAGEDADLETLLMDELTKLGDVNIQAALREQYVSKMYKQALENAYIESMENLIQHPLNFKRLTSPNSADQMKDLAKKVTNKLGFESFDYASTTNMLSRRFMSRMRHAFVTGKYAIGIAAVSQTNHSLNQRQPTYIDIDRFDNLNEVDKYWLTVGSGSREDINLKFADFNRMEMNGRMVPSLSMITNAEGQDISDIIGQFIDGYVDISKGPWIMELGATPNVASTWLFLIKTGVPVETVAYFMNQPIIRDYLRSIEASGYTYLFMKDYVNMAKAKYESKSVISRDALPSKEELFEMMGNKSLNVQQKAQQQFILDEFLKYAKMAEQLFNVTQGSNFDTSTFNDPYLVFKKMMQLEKARKSIISSVDDILDNSFIGELSNSIFDMRDAFAEILKSDQPNIRDVVQTVLMDYIDLPDREFIETARKVVNNLFDWAVQVDKKLNNSITRVLLSDDNVAKQMGEFVASVVKNDQHPLYHNTVIKSLSPLFADAKDSNKPNNLKIKNKDNKVYDQNQMIYAFQELKEYLKGQNSPLYGNLLRLAILQSGLSNSPISFTSLIPYEDFRDAYNATVSQLETFPGLGDFAKLNVFQRNNWNDDDVVPYRKGKQKFNPVSMSTYYTELSFGSKDKLLNDIKDGKIPQVIKLYTSSRQADSDVVVFSWEVGTAKQKREMRAKGDFSFIRKGLFKKVYRGEGKENPLIYPDKKGNPQYIYKMINAWGDSYRANEFYNTARKSVIDNGFLKVENEVSDATMVAYFEASTPSQIAEPKPIASKAAPAAPAAPSLGASMNERIERAYDAAIKTLTFEEINKVLKNQNKEAKNLEVAQNWAYGEYRWLFDGDREYINNFRYALSEEGRKNNLETGTENYSGNVATAKLYNLLYEKIANYVLSQVKSPVSTAPAGVTFVSPKVVKLRDGRNYGLGAVNATMLLDMGYTTDEAGDILKQICS